MNTSSKLWWAATLLVTWLLASDQVNLETALISCLVLICSRYLIEKTTPVFDHRRVTILGFWYVTYFAMIFFPSFFVFANQEGPWRVKYLFCVESALLTVPLGALLAARWANFSGSETEYFFRKPIQGLLITARFVGRYRMLLTLAVALTFLYVSEVRTLPLIYLLKDPGDFMFLATLREDSLKLLDSPFKYAYILLSGVLYPFLILVSLGWYLQMHNKKRLRSFLVTLLFGIAYSSLTLAKSPVAAIFLTLALFLYYYRGGALSRKAIVVAFVLILFFPLVVVLGVYQGTNVGVWTALKAIGSRLFYVPAEVLYYYFEVFPNHVGYLHGRSIDKLAWLLHMRFFDTASYVGHYGFSGPEALETVSANASFIGNLYADFGLLGVLFGSMLAGAIMQWLHIYLIRCRKTFLTLATYAFMVFAFWDLHSTALPIVLATDGVILVFVFRWLFVRATRPVSVYTKVSQGMPTRLPELS